MKPVVEVTREHKTIIINHEGLLFIERPRNGKIKGVRQFCMHYENLPCGDWCPHFSEPAGVDKLYLSICGGITLSAEEIIDERTIAESKIILPS